MTKQEPVEDLSIGNCGPEEMPPAFTEDASKPRPRYNPVPISGEPLSVTILREREA